MVKLPQSHHLTNGREQNLYPVANRKLSSEEIYQTEEVPK